MALSTKSPSDASVLVRANSSVSSGSDAPIQFDHSIVRKLYGHTFQDCIDAYLKRVQNIEGVHITTKESRRTGPLEWKSCVTVCTMCASQIPTFTSMMAEFETGGVISISPSSLVKERAWVGVQSDKLRTEAKLDIPGIGTVKLMRDYTQENDDVIIRMRTSLHADGEQASTIHMLFDLYKIKINEVLQSSYDEEQLCEHKLMMS